MAESSDLSLFLCTVPVGFLPDLIFCENQEFSTGCEKAQGFLEDIEISHESVGSAGQDPHL